MKLILQRVLLSLALATFAASVSAQAPEAKTSERIIAADYANVAGPHSQMYRATIGAGRAAEGVRADWQEQLRLCQQEIGFRTLRFHGIFHDEMGVYTEDKAGHPIYNWQYVDALYDSLLKLGIRPFVELGFTPKALASSDKTVFWWAANVSLPKDWERWENFVTAFVTHLTERYGRDEVRQWNFEIWNEPDVGAFLSLPPGANREAEYFNLYERTARAVKKVDVKYRVGGPACSSPKPMIKNLIDYCDKTGAPLDFITFHVYGLAGQDGGFDEVGSKRYFIQTDPLNLSGTVGAGVRRVAQSSRPQLPIYVTEWNTSYAKHDPVHDSYYNAAYTLGQIKRTEKYPGLAAMSRWTFTDIFEEDGVPNAPFYGGFGLLTVQGIKKPAYFAYKFMSSLGEQELVNNDASSWVCRDRKGGVEALFWDLSYPMPEPLKQSNREFFGQVHPPRNHTPLRLQLSGLKPGRYRATVYRVGFKKNDAFTAYQEMGSPQNISTIQVNQLKALASGAPESQETLKIGRDGRFSRTFDVRSNDIYFVTLTPN